MILTTNRQKLKYPKRYLDYEVTKFAISRYATNLRYPGRDLDHEPSTLAVSLLGSWPRSLKI